MTCLRHFGKESRCVHTVVLVSHFHSRDLRYDGSLGGLGALQVCREERVAGVFPALEISQACFQVKNPSLKGFVCPG